MLPRRQGGQAVCGAGELGQARRAGGGVGPAHLAHLHPLHDLVDRNRNLRDGREGQPGRAEPVLAGGGAAWRGSRVG